MSVNNISKISKKPAEPTRSDVSFFQENKPEDVIREKYLGKIPSFTDYSLAPEVNIPLSACRVQIAQTRNFMAQTKTDIEKLLLNIYINNELTPNLEESHSKLWKELAKHNNISLDVPNYISFNEYKYAEKSMSTSARKLLTEYHSVISQASFSYLFEFRKMLSFMINEGNCIKDILIFKFKEEYEDNSQKEIAAQFDSWAKMASHYTQLIREASISSPGAIPSAEMDKISKRQAVEFQAFFAIRLNAIHEEINNVLNVLKRDYVDNCDIFYSRYLDQAITFKKDMVSSMELDFYTTNFTRNFPFLSEEMLIATNVINANYGMIITDFVQRNQVINSNADKLFALVRSKRKYSNYIFQLSFKGQTKPVILRNVAKDEYASYFDFAEVSAKITSELVSSHSSLDDLGEDHHPQYLLKDGGIITGNIDFASNSKIGGMVLSLHAHDGSDGSMKIKSVDIDYDSIKNDSSAIPEKPLSVSVAEYKSDIVDGGVPVIDAIVNIEMSDNPNLDNLEYEIEIIEI
jgi:hypothetical protein